MNADHEPGLHVDPWGRATLHTAADRFYAFSEPGRRSTPADVDLCLRFALDQHREDVDELLDARLVLMVEEAVA